MLIGRDQGTHDSKMIGGVSAIPGFRNVCMIQHFPWSVKEDIINGVLASFGGAKIIETAGGAVMRGDG